MHKHTTTTMAAGALVAAQSRKTEEFIAADDTVTFEQESIWNGTEWLCYEGCVDQELPANRCDVCKRLLDVVVYGEFIYEQLDATLKWKGSANQRVIDVQKSLAQDEVVLHA